MLRLSCVLVLWAACSSHDGQDSQTENPSEARPEAGASAGGKAAPARVDAGAGGAGGAAGKAGSAGLAAATAGRAGSAGASAGAGGERGSKQEEAGSGGSAAPPRAGAGGSAGKGGSSAVGGEGGSAGEGGAGSGGEGGEVEDAGAGAAAGSGGVDIPPRTPIGLLFSDEQAETLCAMARGNFDGGDLLTIHSGMCAEMTYAAGNTDEVQCRMAQAMCLDRLQEMRGVGGASCTLKDLPDCRDLTAEQFVKCEAARLEAQNAYYITLTCQSDFDTLEPFQTPPECTQLADVCPALAGM